MAPSRQASAELFGFVGEVVAATEDVRSSGAAGWVMRRIAELMRGWLAITRRASLAGTTMWMARTALFAGANALAFALSALLWWQGAVTIGTVYLIFQHRSSCAGRSSSSGARCRTSSSRAPDRANRGAARSRPRYRRHGWRRAAGGGALDLVRRRPLRLRRRRAGAARRLATRGGGHGAGPARPHGQREDDRHAAIVRYAIHGRFRSISAVSTCATRDLRECDGGSAS